MRVTTRTSNTRTVLPRSCCRSSRSTSVPRAGLAGPAVVSAAAELADEVGYQNLTMGLLAERLGVRTLSLYKHVTSLADLQHRIATLAMTELGDVTRDAIAGRAG